MREITSDEVPELLDCIKALSQYHNEISNNYFKGYYPIRDYNTTLELFAESLKNGTSHINIVEDENKVIGFCKVDIEDTKGILDFLVVLEKYRGNGYGKELMDWAMAMFHQSNVEQIEVKVVDGNDTIHLYERYGFKVRGHIMCHICT